MEKLIKFITSARGLAVYLLVFVILLLIGIIIIWPEENNFVPGKSDTDSTNVVVKQDSLKRIQGKSKPIISSVHADSNQLNQRIVLSDSIRHGTSIPKPLKQKLLKSRTLLWLVLLIGAIGSSLHGLNSLSNYIGNKDFKSSWAFWYLLRPFVGGILSFLFYLTIRAGFFKEFGSKQDFYVIVALAGLIGLFSKQALNKLSDLFEFIFTSNKDKDLKDKIGASHVPKIESIEPSTIKKASTKNTLTIKGCEFNETSMVRINKDEIKPKLVSSKELSFELTDNYAQDIGTLQISVFNPEPKGGLSNNVNVNIEP
jgi:hypothetical protein